MSRKPVLYAVIFAFVLIASAAYAQYAPTPIPTAAPNPINRTVLQTVNFPGEQYQTIETLTTIAAGATAPNHTHPGVESSYVLDGEADLFVTGQQPRHVKAGDSWIIPEGVVHSARVTSSKPLKIVTTYVVDKSKPLASAAPQ